jgi:hypothetical protein
VTVLPQSGAADKRADSDSSAQPSQPHSRSAFGWGLVDQVLSSATNFGGSVLAARALSSSGFGAVAIGFSVFLLVLGIARAWSSEPLVIRYSQHRSIAIEHGRFPRRRVVAGDWSPRGGARSDAAAFAFDGTLRSVLLVLAVSHYRS